MHTRIFWPAVISLLLVGSAFAQTSINNQQNPYYPADSLNPQSPTYGSSTYPGQLFNNTQGEAAQASYEYGFANFVSVTVHANACLGTVGAGLTMTPPNCLAYNAGFRNTETGTITFANGMNTWVAMDSCAQTGPPSSPCTQSNPGLPNFTRVNGTHYLLDTIDATQPTMTSNSQLLMEVTTSGGSITSVIDLRGTSPLRPIQPGDAGQTFNVIDYGAVPNARVANTAYDATTTQGSAALFCPTCNFTQADVTTPPKIIMIPGSGPDGVPVGYGVSAASENRTTGAVSVTYTFNPSGNAKADYQTSLAVTSASESGSVVTLVMASTAAFITGQIAYVQIPSTGFLNGYSGQQIITVVDGTHLTYSPISLQTGLSPMTGGTIKPFYFQQLTCTGATCSGTLPRTPVLLQSLNVREPDGADAFDPGPLTLISTISSVADANDLTMGTTAGAANPGNFGFTGVDGMVIIGGDSGQAIQNAWNAAASQVNQCKSVGLATIVNCNAILKIPPGGYLSTIPLSFAGPVANIIVEADGAQLYSAQTGAAITIGPASNTPSAGTGDSVHGLRVFCPMAQGSEGYRLHYQQYTTIDNGTLDNCMVGAEIGTNSGSGNTSDGVYLNNETMAYNGVSALFHSCDNCGVDQSESVGYEDRGFVVGDPTMSNVRAQTVAISFTNIESGGTFLGTAKDGLDLGGGATPITVDHFYHETDWGNGPCIRAGEISGNVTGLGIRDLTCVAAAAGVPNGINFVPNNFVSTVDIDTSLFEGFVNAVSCSGTTSNVKFGPNSYTSVTNQWNGCHAQADVNGGTTMTDNNGNGGGVDNLIGNLLLQVPSPSASPMTNYVAPEVTATGDCATYRELWNVTANPWTDGLYVQPFDCRNGGGQVVDGMGYVIAPVAPSPSGTPTPNACVYLRISGDASHLLPVCGVKVGTPTPVYTATPTPTTTPTATPSATPTSGPIS